MNGGAAWDDVKHELSEAFRDLVALLIGAVEAVLIIVVAVFIARRLRRRTRTALERTALHANIRVLVANAVSIGVYVVAATIVLGVFGANWTALIAVLSVGTLAIGLAFQDVLRNFVAGVYLLVERPFTIGDRIKVKDVEGHVEEIDIRTTILRSSQEARVLVPNAMVFSEIITNRSSYRATHTLVTMTGMSLPVAEIEPAVREALSHLIGTLRPPEVTITASTQGSSDVRVAVIRTGALMPESEVIARLQERFPDATVSLVEG